MKSAKEISIASPAPKAGEGAAPSKGFQRWLPWVMVVIFGGWVLGNLRPPPSKNPFHLDEFGKLPAILNGRVQPIDSVARNTLLIMRSKQTLAIEPEGEMSDMQRMFKTKKMPAIEWMLEVMTHPEQADQRKLFRIDHPEVKALLKLPVEQKHFSFNDIRPQGAELAKEAQRVGKMEEKEEALSPFEKAISRTFFALSTYNRLKNSLQPDDAQDFAAEVSMFERTVPAGLEALKKSQASDKYSEEDLGMLAQFFKRFDNLANLAEPLIIPPADPVNKDGWRNIGLSLKESLKDGKVDPAAKAYATMASAYTKGNAEEFNKAVVDYRDNYLKGRFDRELRKGRDESFFNHFEPFIKAVSIYLVAFMFAASYWFKWNPALRTTGVYLALLALGIHTFGLIFRMYLEGRPPVTNLYSSALFVGWGAAVLGLIIERIFKDGIGAVTASVVGFLTLIIAHNLSMDGDTMKLLQAVLDTNIWLATHVVVITLGYASMFLAGFLAIIYVARGVFTKTLPPVTAKSLTRMVYGIVCFATLFSFVGTVLGGIWADQSWGRFWGWDPKENGALMIVIWCAVVLHARWGGIIRERGLMAMALFGNIVTSFSWWGVNMLGVGLHSYGFMDEAFKWLMGFIVSQLILIGLTLMPQKYWRSASVAKTETAKKPDIESAGHLAAAQKMAPENPA